MRYLQQANLDQETIDRLELIANLEHGWIDGEQGDTISYQAMQFAVQFLEEYVTYSKFSRPSIYPLLEGGITLEWDVPVEYNNKINYKWTIDIYNDTDVVLYVFATNHKFRDKEVVYSHYASRPDKTIKKIIRELDKHNVLNV